ncbi:sodium/calcium exchanger 3-like isoform X2 [Daphnia pulex]|uniref:sodium/calcium exchanger 3-like isoform X2 n=1 Tax=Daphnia pulex TaxID=6669 RepID=UPI001EE135EC|nr:sodium/calcium exchanger 3-like isoform X2 [Daphnia pulex]XP_046450401.1 sodium/calcium exchanger 3-like isoform X2 [Daphnia pulex]XP_046642841.1 sodium/calcium exchanger 3-like isoform X2 [Daphnia pulicaria]
MTRNNGTLDDYTCSNALLLPLISEFTWSIEVRAFLYLFGLLYCFTGVAIIADIFMGAIEKITSTTRKVYLSRGESQEPEVIEVRIWNDTVANLTLMALGSSAPEILLSIIEIVGNNFESGSLGPGTIVGSAAFNLMGISAVCVAAIPGVESRQIKGLKVFAITAVFSILAYLWLIFVLMGVSKNVVEVWEAVVTFLLFPILVYLAYLADKGFPWNKSRVSATTANGKQIELGSIQPVEAMVDGLTLTKDGQVDPNELAKWVRQASRMGLTGEDAAKLAAYKLITSKEHSRAWYRIGATRIFSGSKKIQPQLSIKLREVYDAINENPDAVNLSPLIETVPQNKAIIEFHAIACAVPESVGRFPITIVRTGKTDNSVSVRVETIDGSAVGGQDFVTFNQVIQFEAGELEKIVTMEIIDDNQYEPDEQFYIKLSLTGTKAIKQKDVMLGRISIMEVTVLNDDDPGTITFEERGILVKESVGVAQVPVLRKNGADGEVSVRWRTIDKNAVSGKAYIGGEGCLVFKHSEMKRVIEIPISNDMMPEKDECFEVELSDPTGGAVLGSITKLAVTITNDEEFNSVLNRLADMTTANVDSMEVHHSTWTSQIKDAMNVNGGDIENATTSDYVMHFLTFGWKLLFAFVPPAGIWGGWLSFFVSLVVIGALTAIVGDLASIFGCLVGLDDAVTAITFVALGTSLPDLFASRAAAMNEKYADNAIGNVTGSNSVNVFLGLGLPWLIASIYHASNGNEFKVEAGSLGFSITVFTITAVLSLALLVTRRCSAACGRGELGGPLGTRYASAIFLLLLWMAYVLLSSLETYGHITGF